MVATIGLMIGVYIITRMISLITRQHERAESGVVKVFAVITICVTLICILDLLTRGLELS